MSSITDESGNLKPLPEWVDLTAHPEYHEHSIEQRRAVAIRGRAILPIVAMWVRDAYEPADWPTLEFLDDDLGDLIRAHMGYPEIDDLVMAFHDLDLVFQCKGGEADQRMNRLMEEHPELFDNVAGPDASAELSAAKRLCELHGLVVTEQEVAR